MLVDYIVCHDSGDRYSYDVVHAIFCCVQLVQKKKLCSVLNKMYKYNIYSVLFYPITAAARSML